MPVETRGSSYTPKSKTPKNSRRSPGIGRLDPLTPAWGARGSSSYGWNYLHQGGRYDADGGLYSFRHREYSPTLGRWLQNDPIGFAARDANLGRYSMNAPLSRVDPMGLEHISLDGMIGAFEILMKKRGLSASAITRAGRVWKRDAEDFAIRMGKKYGKCPGIKAEWISNVARHFYWQGMLAARYGVEIAKAVGDAHESGDNTIDSLIDRYHNELIQGMFGPFFYMLKRDADFGAVRDPYAIGIGIGAMDGILENAWKKNHEKQTIKSIEGAFERMLTDGGVCPSVKSRFIIDLNDVRITKLPGYEPGLPVNRDSSLIKDCLPSLPDIGPGLQEYIKVLRGF